MRPSGAIPLLLVLAASIAATGAERVAATVDGEPILLREVDALAPALTRDVHERLLDTARSTLERLAAEADAEELRLSLPAASELERPLAPDRIVAHAGDTPVRAAALEEAAALRLYRLRGELALERLRNLDTLIDRALLRAEAERRGVTLQALERELAAPQPVSDAEVRRFLEAERAAGNTELDAARARPYVEFRKQHARRAQLIQRLRATADIQVNLQPLQPPRLPVAAADGVPLTASQEPVLVAYTNYHCRLCRATHAELDALAAAAEPPRIVLRDFVMPGDDAAREAAALVRCAAREGRQLAVRAALLETDVLASLTSQRLDALAAVAGLSPAMLQACMRSEEIQAAIDRDTREAFRLGFDQPPAFVAAGMPLSGMQTAAELRAALEAAR